MRRRGRRVGREGGERGERRESEESGRGNEWRGVHVSEGVRVVVGMTGVERGEGGGRRRGGGRDDGHLGDVQRIRHGVSWDQGTEHRGESEEWLQRRRMRRGEVGLRKRS